MNAQLGTVCVTVDNLGAAQAIWLRAAHRPDPNEAGLRHGLPRLLDLFADLKITATFFVEGWNALHHPDALTTIAAAGHEIGLHGWVHENWAELDDHDQERLLFDGTAALRALGITPVGFRAPGGYRGTRTAAILAELGYRYDSSITPDLEHQPLRVHRIDEQLVCVPWAWTGNDFWQYYMNPDGPQAEHQAKTTWLAQIEDAAVQRGLVTLTMHPFVTGVDDAKLAVYHDVLQAALTNPRLTVANADTVADHFRTDERTTGSPLLQELS